jgi:LPS-assembly lipoprotein
MITFCRSLFVTLLAVLLTGCGFQLRGYEPLPDQLKVLYLQTDSPYSAFTKQLKVFLTSAKVTIVDRPQAAPVTLQILSDNTAQTLTSTGASGQTNTYTLTYTVVYQLLARNGEVIQSPQTVSTMRNYSVTSNQVLGDTNVQNTLLGQMRRDVIYLMLNRMRTPQALKAISAKLNGAAQ